LNTPTGDLYTSLQLECMAYHHSYPQYFNWINVSGLPSTSAPTAINSNGLIYNVNFSFNSLNLLVYGNYAYKIIFTISGVDGSNVTQLYTYEYTINLMVTSQAVTFSPAAITLNHFQNTAPLPSQVITMNGPSWVLSASLFNNSGAHLVLSSPTPGVVISSDMQAGELIQSASGSGQATIVVTLDSFYDIGIVNPLYLSGNLAVISGTAIVAGIPFTVNVFNQGTMNISPSPLSFYAVKGVQEPTSQLLTVNINAPSYLVTKSPWLILTPNGSNYDVVPIPTLNMSPGTYTGFIHFKQ